MMAQPPLPTLSTLRSRPGPGPGPHLEHDIAVVVDGLDDGHLLAHDAEEVDAASGEERAAQPVLLGPALRSQHGTTASNARSEP